MGSGHGEDPGIPGRGERPAVRLPGRTGRELEDTLMDREDEIYMDARVKRPEAVGLIEKDKEDNQ